MWIVWTLKLAIAGLATLALSGRAAATLVQVDYTGVAPFIGAELAGGPIVNGDLVSGTLVYDTTAPDSIGSDDTEGLYDAIVSHTITVGSYTASMAANAASSVRIRDDFQSNDQFFANIGSAGNPGSLVGNTINGLPPTRLQFTLSSSDLSRLSSDSLPLPNELNNFLASEGTTSFNFLVFGNNPANVRFNLTSFTAQTVPEPTTALLLAAGLVGWGWIRRRKRS